MRRRLLVLVILGALVALPHTASADDPPRYVDPIDGELEECSSLDTLAPTRFEEPVVGDYSKEVVLDVHVLMYGIGQPEAERIMSYVAPVYEPLKIKVDATYERVELKVDNDDADSYINASREAVGGQRPWHADVVYTMIGGEIESTVAGKVDCVGGIAYPEAAFGVGEALSETENDIRDSAKIAAHEIGHLLAAHHHFTNCAEGDHTYFPMEDWAACTVMFPDLFMVSLRFGTLEGIVVREYALEYADATPTSPPANPPPSGNEPPPSEPTSIDRTITVKVTKKNFAKGSLTATGRGDSCTAIVPLGLQIQGSNGNWSEVADGYSDERSAFRFKLDTSSGSTYRIHAPQVRMGGGVVCNEAFSPAVTSR